MITGVNHKHAPEQLLIKQHAEGMDIALFLDKWLLDHFQEDDPLEQLHHGNFDTFCTVLEGVSHFIYLIWNAEHQRTITRFELELQAEVDKYVMAVSLLAEQSGGYVPWNLHRCLFEKITYHQNLNHPDYQRYHMANFYARRYCFNLHKHLTGTSDCASLTREIRRFYRLLNQQKIARINNLPVLH